MSTLHLSKAWSLNKKRQERKKQLEMIRKIIDVFHVLFLYWKKQRWTGAEENIIYGKTLEMIQKKLGCT